MSARPELGTADERSALILRAYFAGIETSQQYVAALYCDPARTR